MSSPHSHAQGIEGLTTAAALNAFAERQAAVTDTVDAHELYRGAIIIGTAGLALHGINAYVGPEGDASTFDIDAALDDNTFHHLQTMKGVTSLPADAPSEVHIPATKTALPVTGLKSPFTYDIATSLRANNFNGLCSRAVPVGGVLTLPPTELARAKMERGEPKDLFAILKGHWVAWNTWHPIVTNAAWQGQVIGARNALELKMVDSRRGRQALPTWLGQLAASRFDHPAFTLLNPGPIALRRAS